MFKYIYNPLTRMHTYDGDLSKDLLILGVSEEHIKKMQTNVVRGWIEDKGDECGKSNELVPLDKVVSFSRGDVGVSIYNNVVCIPEGHREPNRFYNGFMHVCRYDSLKDAYASYEKLMEPVKMYYDIDEDIYRVSTDGNHRTLMAKLLGAPAINARVTKVHYDPVIKKRYFRSVALSKKLGIQEIRKVKTLSDDKFCVTFNANGEQYDVLGYSELADTNVDHRLNRFEQAVLRDTEIARKIISSPQWLRKLLFLFTNGHVRQHVEKIQNKNAKRNSDIYLIYK